MAPRAVAQLGGFPVEALTALARRVGRVCEDPYDAVVSNQQGVDRTDRWAMFGDRDQGFFQFSVRDDILAVVVVDVTWAG
ncbi:MAG: hypothetical protein ABIS86_11335 [Streptosporangiaceae bacterium]